ncbi:MAG: dihydrolipoyl dehydrogenase [Candidatus Krumholzibacteria bacterium]|jgi:dihydrolipoamide dehydrogenase|nr:dihydrolipoyl dehydrogenase [Candidatus Krumholzibacteria bacterium]
MVMGQLKQECELVVIGAGPGGYVAALRAADLGMDVTLVEAQDKLGGVCLREGCIPSKTLIHAVEVAESARNAEQFGLKIDKVEVDPAGLRKWTRSVVDGLSSGIEGLLKKRGVEVIHACARFDGHDSLALEGAEVSGIRFQNCIIATGSRINELPAGQDLPLWTSAEALQVPEIPDSLLVVGGGYIGLEMGMIYAGLGSKVTMVEFFPSLLQGADRDLLQVVVNSAENRFEAIHTDSRVTEIEKTETGFLTKILHDGDEIELESRQVLSAVGRRPNTDRLNLEMAGLSTDEQGRIPVDEQCRSSVAGIFAIGDIAPGPMLAHKASREAKVAAEAIAGHSSSFDNRAIPAVVFTEPELAWAGLTEREAEEKGITVKVGRFPLAALGRARTLGRRDGLAKVICDPETDRVLGVGMVGPQASELIAEGTLAIEMGATLEDLMVTIHPHPTLSEALFEAAEVAAGQAIHIQAPKK